MPIVHIYLLEGKPQTYLQALGDSVHQALVETWGLPESDRFQIFHEKKAEHFKIDRFSYLEDEGVQRSDDVIVIQITTSPRTIHMKRAFYKRLPELLKEKIGLSPGDVFINVVMVDEEDWSVGVGKMTLIERLK
jgi:phenylpyruvate tautomerase PptA (4-oxalocrotonate tautomerase family)